MVRIVRQGKEVASPWQLQSTLPSDRIWPFVVTDRWILLGYVALAILAIAAIYFASTQPGFTEADPVSAIALPTNDRLRLVVWCLGMLHMGAHLSALATRA